MARQTENKNNEIIFEEMNLNEYRTIGKILEILSSEPDLDNSLQLICSLLPEVYAQPENVYARIIFDGNEYTSKNFTETAFVKKRNFEIPNDKKGVIQLFFDHDFAGQADEKPLFKEDSFLDHVSTIVSGAISRIQLKDLHYDIKERLKELMGINFTTKMLKDSQTLEESLQEICSFLPEAWQYPEHTVARIRYENKVFTSKNFMETRWCQKQSFETPDNKKGLIEVFYLKAFPDEDEGPFLKEERNLIDNLAALISGSVSRNNLQVLLAQNTERLKELHGLNQTSAILKENRTLEESLQLISSILPDAWQYPEFTAVRITFEKKVFVSPNFRETPWTQTQTFEAPKNKQGLIEVFYLKEFPQEDEGPFLKEERNLLINLANLIAGSATKDIFNKLLSENRERLKELKGINLTSRIIAEGKSLEETLQEICNILPKAWQYPNSTVTRIRFEGKVYCSRKFKVTRWMQKESFVTIDNKKGTIEICYLKEFPQDYEGPFMREERQLLINIAKLISGYINNLKGRDIYRRSLFKPAVSHKAEEYRKSLIKDKQPLQLFFNKQIIDKYIYFDMMKYKIKEILFVATLYDAFILENEDHFFEQFMGEIYQYSLFSLPRITGVTSAKEAMELLETTSFDLIILMAGIDQHYPLELAKKIKKRKPDIPIYLLLNQKSNIQYFEDILPASRIIDKLFVWNGDSQIFFAIVKSIEDKANVENDTRIGLVRVILLLEDSAQYYSKYLPILYSIVFGQVQQTLVEVEKNELDKICKMRSRPKILLARNYEDAIYLFHKYKDFLLCIISDVEFEKEGRLDKTAGINFIKYAKSNIKNLPIILQSADTKNEKIAQNLGVGFVNKNSESLLNDLKNFLTRNLAFGDFVFRNKEGKQIAVARSLNEFLALLHTIPEESLYTHANENQFSLWIMGRGEIHLAKILNPLRITDFPNIHDIRTFLIQTIKKYLEEKKKGKVLGFDESTDIDEKNIVNFSSGSLGGKGRGLAFINTLIYNIDFSALSKYINIRTPKTAIIGIDEFEIFIEKNRLYERIFNPELPYQKIREYFYKAQLSGSLMKKLEVFIDQISRPIAVRSSSLSEDSITQPFAGVFDTIIIPNNHPNKFLRFQNLVDAIKLVYASVYSGYARTYFKAINHKVEEERMAIVLQELAGQQFEDYYYPHISGIANSHNYYPVSHMKPEEGFAIAALGLGSYVVEGGKAFRFSPKYPNIEMFSTRDLLNSTQVDFYAVDLSKQVIDLMKYGDKASLALLEISAAEKHGTLKHLASVYNSDNDRIEEGLVSKGPRILNFADILKHNYIPLAETIDIMLHTVKEALGSPVELEYAVDLTKTINDLPSFYLLQIKPLVENLSHYVIDPDKVDQSRILLYTTSSLGNGKIKNIRDVIYVDVDKFSKLKTLEMVNEIEELNHFMSRQNKQYVLIGPGRWGTRDQFLGIPVIWPQISNAKVIVEISLPDFPLDSSLGSHFFHNLTSMNVGYLSVRDSSSTDYIQWKLLDRQRTIHRTNHFRHIRFENPLTITMDGKSMISVIQI
ncbi:MAG: hypothetical protein JW723_14200 [Bacteroidales bacterium]|nr:hypothetical protein [Bacteroidales bacterium]